MDLLFLEFFALDKGCFSSNIIMNVQLYGNYAKIFDMNSIAILHYFHLILLYIVFLSKNENVINNSIFFNRLNIF